MQKILDGKALAGYIQERQVREVRALRQAHGVQPRLAIVLTVDNPVIDLYVRLKKSYGAELKVDVDVHKVEQSQVPDLLQSLNDDPSIHGVIVQLPLADVSQTDQIVKMVAAHKDVDALGIQPAFDPATPTAILWLLAGYNVELKSKRILLVGRGKLVGTPLEAMLKTSGLDVISVDSGTSSDELKSEALAADIIVTATGRAGLITADIIKSGSVVVDAGVASEKGETVGDLSPEVYDRDDITVTPTRGGVGPLTVCALFENVIRAARLSISKSAS